VLADLLVLETVLGYESGQVVNTLIDIVASSALDQVVRLPTSALLCVRVLANVDLGRE
jgi:hypothetical protein